MNIFLNKYGAGLVLLVVLLGLHALPKATHDRVSMTDQANLSFVRITEGSNEVKITQIRDFSEEDGPKYINRAYDLSQLQGADVLAETPFMMTRFRFENAENLVFSVQPRLEQDENHTRWKTYLPFYEVFSLIATESDALKESPDIAATLPSSEAKTLFLQLAQENNQLFEQAKFYNALRDK